MAIAIETTDKLKVYLKARNGCEYSGPMRSAFLEGFENGYIQGTTEQDPISRADQKKIDVKKACEWLRQHLDHWKPYTLDREVVSFTGLLDSFKEAMEG